MASDPKPTVPAASPVPRDLGVRLFTYPKVIFMFPTLIVALICGLGMSLTGNRTADPYAVSKQQANLASDAGAPELVATPDRAERLNSPANLFGVLFLGVFLFNLLVMALDFPRFTIIAVVVFGLFGIFFFLWLGTYFNIDLLNWVKGLFGLIYVEANSGFYYTVVAIMLFMYATIYVSRYLDYWEIRPNEILHHHGPLSDLERFPTINLKFGKEIPDVLEFLFLGSGRIVLNIQGQSRAVVLDNVLFINSVERSMKNLMSRMEVRVTTDREAASDGI